MIIQHMANSEADRKGLYRNKMIQKVINSMFFANKHDEGVVYTDLFNPIPTATIALVLTAVCLHIIYSLARH